MSFKEKAVFKKYEWEYNDADNDTWSFIIVEHEGRRIVQFGQPDREPVSIEGAFLLDMADKYREVTSKVTKSRSVDTGGRSGRGLSTPSIVDHRSGAPDRGQQIDDSVQESMRQYDDSVAPVQSFSGTGTGPWDNPVNAAASRSGVNIHDRQEPGETPAEWQNPGWKEDVDQRSLKGKPMFRTEGDEGANFKRIGAADLV